MIEDYDLVGKVPYPTEAQNTRGLSLVFAGLDGSNVPSSPVGSNILIYRLKKETLAESPKVILKRFHWVDALPFSSGTTKTVMITLENTLKTIQHNFLNEVRLVASEPAAAKPTWVSTTLRINMLPQEIASGKVTIVLPKPGTYDVFIAVNKGDDPLILHKVESITVK